MKFVGLGWREGAAEVSSRAVVGIISDSLYPFENENAPLGELTAAPHPREVLGVSLARAVGLRDTERMSRNLRPDRRSRPAATWLPPGRPPYVVRSRCGLDTRRRPPRFIPLR